MNAPQLKSFSLQDLGSYLRFSGWKCIGEYPDKAFVFQNESKEILVPQHEGMADYLLRLEILVKELSNIEQRSDDNIIADLQGAGSDTFRVRVASPEIEDGLVSLEKGSVFFEAVKAMVQSAARSAQQPKAHYRARLPLKAENYMKDVRLGQTEVGSYIVKVLLPVTPSLQEEFFSHDLATDFERQVSSTLMSGLSALSTGVRRAVAQPTAQFFLENIPNGVSANLCDSVSMLGETVSDASVDTSMNWAKTRAAPNGPSKAHFTNDDFSYLQGVSCTLKEQDWGEELELQGMIRRLESEKRLDGGDVTLATTIEGKRRNIKVHLNPEQYEQAVEAHKAYSDVALTGIVERRGQSLIIEKVVEISALTEE